MFNIGDGLPQGSPLSPILYIIYNSSLLLPDDISPDANQISIGFIDDVTHLVADREVNTNISRLESIGAQSLEWGRTHGAIFDERKAQLMHFTHKHHDNPSLTFGSFTLQPQDATRWLGLWLDPKLTFNVHMKKIREKGTHTVAQLRRINKSYSGLNPREAKNLVTSVLRSRILHGSIVWFTAPKFGKVMKIFRLLENEANRLILGAFKTSPTELMHHDSNLLPFSIAATRLHHLFLHKRMTAPNDHPTKRFIQHELRIMSTTHKSPITNLIRLDDFLDLHHGACEIIKPFPSTPWESSIGELHNMQLTREEALIAVPQQIDDETTRGTRIVFTDGSLTKDGGGAAAVSPTTVRSLGCPSANVTNNELELLALALAIADFKDFRLKHPETPNRLAIFSDSQTALRHAHDPLRQRPMQHLAGSVKKFLLALGNTELQFFWVPGHEAVKENEEADKAAKEAAESGANSGNLLPMSLSKLVQTTRTSFHLRTAAFTTGREDLKTQPRKIADALARLEKGQAASIFQLRSGHCPLNGYLHRFNHHQTGKCDVCRAPETVPHFLLYCRRFKIQRGMLRKRLTDDEVKVNPYSLKSLLNTPSTYPRLAQFILETGRFTYLKSYLDKEGEPTKKKTRKHRPTC